MPHPRWSSYADHQARDQWRHGDAARGEGLVTLEIQMPEDVDELAKRLEGWKDTGNPRAKLGM